MTKITSIGNFSSSQNYRLMGSDKVAMTYVKDKNLERKFMKKIDKETDAKPTSWGNMLEGYVFNKLDFSYRMVSKESLIHPDFNCWTGTPDLINDSRNIVADIKCPYTLKSFYNLTTSVNIFEDYPEYYWQLVSNSILTGKNIAELIVYCPYESEFDDIKSHFSEYEHKDSMKWFENCDLESLPFIKSECKFKNLNVITINIFDKDKFFMTERVEKYSKFLI